MARLLSLACAVLLLDRSLARLALGALSTADALATIALVTACVLYAAGAWASADVARLERELADAENARDRHHLRARLLADGILDVAAGRPLDARLDSIDADNLRALAAHLDAQRPHGPAADVERVVVGEGTVTTAFGRGRVWWSPENTAHLPLSAWRALCGDRRRDGVA